MGHEFTGVVEECGSQVGQQEGVINARSLVNSDSTIHESADSQCSNMFNKLEVDCIIVAFLSSIWVAQCG